MNLFLPQNPPRAIPRRRRAVGAVGSCTSVFFSRLAKLSSRATRIRWRYFVPRPTAYGVFRHFRKCSQTPADFRALPKPLGESPQMNLPRHRSPPRAIPQRRRAESAGSSRRADFFAASRIELLPHTGSAEKLRASTDCSRRTRQKWARKQRKPRTCSRAFAKVRTQPRPFKTSEMALFRWRNPPCVSLQCGCAESAIVSHAANFYPTGTFELPPPADSAEINCASAHCLNAAPPFGKMGAGPGAPRHVSASVHTHPKLVERTSRMNPPRHQNPPDQLHTVGVLRVLSAHAPRIFTRLAKLHCCHKRVHKRYPARRTTAPDGLDANVRRNGDTAVRPRGDETAPEKLPK